MKKLLEARDLNLTYHTKQGETEALQNLNFSIYEKEFVSIVGPSGCGKTTILSIIAGLLKPSSGYAILDGTQINGINTKVGYMFQKDNLFEWLTVKNNVLLGLKIQKKLTPTNVNFACDLLTKYKLNLFENHYPSQLSGGMRQRVALIRTLAMSPKLLLLDEPFSALDYQTRLDIQEIVYDIIKREQKTAILVTHDIGEAICMSDRVIILSKRPASVKTIVDLSWDKKLTPFEKRNDPKFKMYFNTIWEELK